jgi:hypothetical protein
MLKMQHYSHLTAYAVYTPPFEGMPWLSVTLLPDGSVQAARFPTEEEAELHKRQTVSTLPSEPTKEQVAGDLYPRVLREALRHIQQTEGGQALDQFLERARLVLMVDIPNLTDDEHSKNALAFESVRRDTERVRNNPAPGNEPLEVDADRPPIRAG